jgi:hypothetical protein
LSEILNINEGVRQGCGLSPALLNLYIIQLIREWISIIATGLKICILKTTLNADNQTILAKIDDELQLAANTPDKIALKYNMKIQVPKQSLWLYVSGT